MSVRCFACNRIIKGARYLADCADDQKGVYVGPDCFQHILDQAEYARMNNVENPGYQPPKGGPKLFPQGDR